MRLQQLTMRNFGPYRDETVDFTAFETTQLFLISGKTGSGKTTIFDALVYALYGTTTGGERTGNEMRASFATPDEATEVVLKFSHGGRDYVIRRAPEQLLAKKRGVGLTKVAAKVSLKVFVDGAEETELTKVQTVKERVQALLQLDADQFRQMVLLPQGKFRQFLDANSDAKGALLRHLFGTELYARWQTTLQTAAKKQSAMIAKQQAQLSALVAQFDYGDAAPAPQATLAEHLAAMQTAVAAQKTAIASATNQATAAKKAFGAANAAYHEADMLQAAYAQAEAAKGQLAELAQAKPELEAAATRLVDLQWAHELAPVSERIASRRQQQTQLTAAIQQTSTALAQAQTTLQAAQRQQAQLAQQEAAVTAAKSRLQTLTSWQAQLQVVADATAAVQRAQAKQTQTQDQRQAIQTDVTAGEAAVVANQAAQAALATEDITPELQAAENLAAKLAGLAKQLKQTQARLRSCQQQQADVATQITTRQQAAQDAQQHYTDLHDRRLNNQIAALVAQLSPAAPCPVCGSLDHPHPAVVQAQAAVAPEALQAADAKRTAAQSRLAKVQAQAAQLEAQATQWQQDVTDVAAQIQALAGTFAHADAEATLTAQAQQLAQLRQTAAAQQQRRQALEAKAQRLQEKQRQLLAQQAEITTAAQNAQVALAAASAELTADRARLPEALPTVEEITTERDALQKRITDHDQATVANQATLQTARDQQTRLQTQLTDQQNQAHTLAAQLTTEEQRLADALANHHHTPEATFNAWLADGDAIAGLQERLTSARETEARQKALLEAADKQIADRPLPDVAALMAARQQADQAATAAQQVVAEISQQHKQATRLYQQTQAGYSRNQEALTKGVAMQNLAAVVSGNNAQKLSLERYVLRAYLQQVLVVANKRLEGLSDGRYQLLLHQDPGSYRNDSGLEIDVYDDQVGETRSVHTLSGGESFIAALALALALGEVIQQSAGGITIDALFIDEGFGSLDSASLDTALEALETIEGQSRMIGIISHVESLQSGVPDQLRVRPTGAGDSHIQVVHLGE
ncbi:AAA family ATPase [Lacticaseibacillus sp. GG6-2]